MLNQYGIIALDLARQRTRELEPEAARNRLLAEHRGDPRPSRPGLLRALVARPVRAFSNASQSIADVTCTAATRIEGRSA